jgi:hypothetical protein
MHTGNLVADFLLTSALAGLLGVAALELAMWLMTSNGLARGNMVVALGSLLTRSRARAFRVGLAVHLLAGIGFAMLYVWALRAGGLAHFPVVLAAGLGFGAAHGILVSLMLVWVVADHHPLEEFREADLAIGLSHFAGHVAYGAVVGLVTGLASL